MRRIAVCSFVLLLLATTGSHPQFDPTPTEIPTLSFVETPRPSTAQPVIGTETPVPTQPPIATPIPGTPPPDSGDPPIQPFPTHPVYLPIILRP